MTDNQEIIIKKEEKILAEEKQILAEVKKEEQEIKKAERRLMIMFAGGIAVIVGALGGLFYWRWSAGRVYIENSMITAPIINLSSIAPGVLQAVMVREGDAVSANAVVARVNNWLIKTKVAGEILSVHADLGRNLNPGEAVVSMIDPSELRVVGSLEEDKGLVSVEVGDPAYFTVDAFGSRRFYGTVDEISPTSRQSDVVFTISDKRQQQQFDVKVRFDTKAYPELKNGMSAKIWILKN